jgi:hypothetical protein
VTLTYPSVFPADGPSVKRHLKRIVDLLRLCGVRGMWFLEFQQRGAPHLHLFCVGVRRWMVNGRTGERRSFKSWLSDRWYGIVGSGDVLHLAAGSRVEMLREQHAVSSYAAKYAAKQEQKEVPGGFERVGRFWGAFGGLRADPERVIVSTVEVPAGAVEPAPDLARVGGVRVDSERLVLVSPAAVGPLVRFARNLYGKLREASGLARPRDRGLAGFRTFGTGPATALYLRHGLLA